MKPPKIGFFQIPIPNGMTLEKAIKTDRISRPTQNFPTNYSSKEYLPLAQVTLSERYFNKLLNEPINVRTKEYDDLRNMLNALYIGDIQTAENINSEYLEKREWQELYYVFQRSGQVRNIIVSLLSSLEWSKNKQVFKFDADFFKELAETESIMLKKDMFNYLPYKTFYLETKDIGIPDSSEIDGMFVNVVKVAESYDIRLSFFNAKEKEQIFYHFLVKNADYEIKIQKTSITEINLLSEILNSSSKKIDYNYWEHTILQILTYLCSVEPDIQESEETKNTYKKPNANFKPKNKYSEVQKWVVGVRFGTSIRKWRSQRTSYSTTDSNELGRHNKPHYRRGHWHCYWCSETVDGKKIKRLVPKWLAPILVNKDLCEDVDVVIHKS